MSSEHNLPVGCFLLALMMACATHVEGKTTLTSLGLRSAHVQHAYRKFGSGNTFTSLVKHFNENLIYHGHPTYPMEFTFQIAILVNTSTGFVQICGGVLISQIHILTAAHCLELTDKYDYFVAAGIHNLTLGENNPGSRIVPLLSFHIHPDYNISRPGFPNDIAIIEVAGYILENDYIQYAVLATKEMGNFNGRYCKVTGWGKTEDGRPDILHFGYQYIPTVRSCKLFWAIDRSAKVTKRHVCGYNYPTSLCVGDIGGPLSCDGVVVGLVSWGLSTCSGCIPGVYTRVAFHTRWIIQTMNL